MLLNNLKNEVSKLLESSLNLLDNVKRNIKTFSIDDNQWCLFPYRPTPINEDGDIEKYKKLKTKDSPSVKYEDLPEDFTIEGWKFVNEKKYFFIKKSQKLLILILN